MRIRLAAVLALLVNTLSASALVITEGNTTDFIVLYSSGYYLSVDRHPNTLGTFAAPQWNTLVNNEPVYVIAHGQQGSIGTVNPMNGTELAAWIGAPNWFTTEVYVGSCESAVSTVATPSVVTAAAKASRTTRTFTGYAGCAITDAAGSGERVVLPEKVAKMTEIQNALILAMNPQAQIDNFIAAYQLAHAGANPPLLLLAQTAYQDQTIKNFYAELLKQGARAGCFYQAGKGTVTKKGKR